MRNGDREKVLARVRRWMKKYGLTIGDLGFVEDPPPARVGDLDDEQLAELVADMEEDRARERAR